MKPFVIILTLSLALLSIQSQAQESDIQAYLTYSKFYSPQQGNYVENNLAVKGSSLLYKKTENGNFKSKLAITMIFRKNDSIVSFKKYNLFSPALDDTSNIDFNFVDQKRFQLDTGSYNFQLKLMDVYKDTTPMVFEMPVIVDFSDEQIEISSIQLVESFKKSDKTTVFTKNGMKIIPYISEFYPKNINTLTFYSEVYNTDDVLGKDKGYLATYYLESYESNEVMDQYSGFKRMKAQAINVFLHKFDISSLPTGNYNIVVEIKNRKNERIAIKKKFFQRLNPDVNYDLANLEAVNVNKRFTEQMKRDSLMKYIPALDPIAGSMDKIFVRSDLKKKSVKTMQKFFLNFWQAEDPENPEKAWVNYQKQVQEVDKFYGTGIKDGYETDRGRVYLQYGPPNTISERDHEPSSYPYEIWHYHKLNENQWNKKFVFYSPDLVTNDYELIHSNAIGEVYNPTWQYLLNKRNSITNDPYETQNPDHWGSEAEELFENPY